MNMFLFGVKLNQCKTDEEKAALYAEWPEFAKLHENNMAEYKRCMTGFDQLRPLPISKSIDVEGQHKIGSIIKHAGHQYRVVCHFHLSPQEVRTMEEVNDLYMNAGDWSHAKLVDDVNA